MNHVTQSLPALLFSLILAQPASAESPPPAGKTTPLFDGRTLEGWEGDPKIWRVEDGMITGGSLTETVKRNEFVASTRDFTNFIVRFKIRLTGTNGFVNSGFQIRSQRVPKSSEMAGYQCDFGEPNWYGAIYDESRRNKVMSPSDMKALRPVLKPQDWNDYVIRADGPRITTWINGAQGTDYTETNAAIVDWGKFGIQVHGGGKALVQVKDITVEELPPTPPGKKFLGAPEPGKGAKASPLTPDEERASFTLPPGFEIELVAAESEGVGKFVAVDWDLQGRLWTMTALEYPVDANENAAFAKELYASKAKDKVLVFDRDPTSPTGYATKPRVFADGLAIPLGVLPYKNGVYVQHGPDIVFLSDTDGDGRADKREVILSGFGVQDSHLFPHQFTRAPGGWIWMAQGAFNYGKVRTKDGREQQFDQTRMAKFRYDGSDFEITSQGPCNIWGLVLTAEGEAWIQEANDYGYPVMPFHEYANYPGCSDAQMKSYAPEFPGTAPDFRMGGTGLSGLALTDACANDELRMTNDEKGQTATGPSSSVIRHSSFRSWPEAYCDVMYVANPITRKIQAIKITRDGGRYRYQKLPDFVQSSDEWFRPVALRLGPDGCLYFVDWYNKIISHNEVPRNHPERDKKRGRIWRVKHKDVKPLDVPDFTKLSGDELVAKLGGPNTPQSHLAWQAIGDRQLTNLAPKLRRIVSNEKLAAAKRIASLWALASTSGLTDEWGCITKDSAKLFQELLKDSNRNIRRETVRVLGPITARDMRARSGLMRPSIVQGLPILRSVEKDNDPEVRQQLIKSLAQILAALQRRTNYFSDARYVTPLIASLGAGSLEMPVAKSSHNGKTIKVGEAYEREFERYLVRFFLEQHPLPVEECLSKDQATSLPIESRLLMALALEPKSSAPRVAELLPSLTRAPGQEELLRLAQFPEEPGVGEALKKVLQSPATGPTAMESLLKVRTRLDAAKLTPLLADAAKQLLAEKSQASLELGARLASSFQIAAVEPELVRVLQEGWGGYPKLEAREYLLRPESLAALRALRELKSDRVDLFAPLAEKGGAAEQPVAVAALAASRNPKGPEQLASLYPNLTAASRRTALASLTATKSGANAVVKSVRAGTIAKDELDAALLDKLQTVLGNDPDLAVLLQEMDSLLQPLLRFEGKPDTFVSTKYKLAGPFTVECWLKLDPGINNQDGILAGAGQLDMNFHDARFRVWVGGGQHDIVIAQRKTVPDVWTHYAVTRDAVGVFRIYINGQLDATSTGRNTNTFGQLDVGRTNPGTGGTAGWMNEFRVWKVARSASQILADFDRTYRGESPIENSGNDPRLPGLVALLTGKQWPSLHGAVKIQRAMDAPPLLNAAESAAVAERFGRFRTLAEKSGATAHGLELFSKTCQACHSVGGQGGQIGPVLNGAGALGVEALLRNILTPNAAMEPGYRAFRVELKDGDVVDGLLVSQDPEAIVLRRQSADDLRIAQKDVRRAAFTKMSLMPEGLLDGLKPEEVTDLFAYLKTLR